MTLHWITPGNFTVKGTLRLFIILLVSGLLILACEKEMHMTQPTILFDAGQVGVFEPIGIRVVEFAEIDGERIVPDHYLWEILDKNEVPIMDGFPDGPSITWIPDSAGMYIIRLQLTYDDNKRLTAFEKLDVTYTPGGLHKKLTGKWRGEVSHFFGINWNVTLSFDSLGHYSGRAEDLSDSTWWPIGPFFMGTYETDNYDEVSWLPDTICCLEAPGSPTYNLVLSPPSDDVPCTLFNIREVRDNLGYGYLSTSYESETWGRPYAYGCTDAYKIYDLQFLDENRLYFRLQEFHKEPDEYWEMEYRLTRMDE
jgi:hypothetical protein